MNPTFDDGWLERRQRIYAARVRAAGLHLQGEIRKMISIPSRTVTVGTTKAGKAKQILGRRGSNRSKPGEPPHKDFGRLRQSIAVDTIAGENPAARIGSALRYAKFLELGTSRMAARPYLRRALKEQNATITAIITTGKVA